jgi:hypothetical protein
MYTLMSGATVSIHPEYQPCAWQRRKGRKSGSAAEFAQTWYFL